MVIELSGVQFGSKSNARFKIARPRSGSAICYSKFDFEPKLHDTKFDFKMDIINLEIQHAMAARRLLKTSVSAL